MDVAGKVAVVTGGGGGIGRALARALAGAGAKVAVADIDSTAAEEVAASVGGIAVHCDVSDEAQIEALVTSAVDQLGPIDIFFSNAGIATAGDPWVGDDQWQHIWQVNVMSHVYAARAVLPSMLDRGHGYLVQTASAAGLLTQIGSAPYAVTKHAAVGFAEYLAITYGDRGIRVSVLAPQAVRTAMTADLGGGLGSVASVDGIMEPEDVARITLEGIAQERFLILPHPRVGEYFRRKADDYDRWLAGMRRLQASLVEQ